MDRDAFMSRVGRSAMRGSLPPPPLVAERLPDLPAEDLVSLFRDRAQQVDAVVHGPVSRHGAPKAVVGIAAGHGCRSFLAWDDLPSPGVPGALTSAGVERVEHHVPGDGRAEHLLGYRDVDLGVTGADAGLAESGSIVLSHGSGRARMASLIPEVHVAILHVGLIERTISHFAHRHSDWVSDTTNLVVISGPSRTGDIELQLNLGVHGPRHLHVVLIS